MTIFGKKIDGFANQIGKKLSYNNLRQFGNKIANVADKGLHIADRIGGVASNILGTGAKVATGLGFGVIGTGLNLAKNVVDIGRQGVKGLEKHIDTAKSVGNAIDRNHKSLGNAIMNGNSDTIISAGKQILNPLKQI